MTRYVTGLGTAAILALVLGMGCDLVLRGADGFHGGYLVEAPSDLGRAGGIGPVLVSTALMVSLSTVLATIISLSAAILLTEVLAATPFRRLFVAIIDIGLGVPRILWGLFGGVLFGDLFGFSIITGALTLTCLLCPVLLTGFVSGLHAVDPNLREQCASLGVTRWIALWTKIVPAARPAFLAAIALGVGRGCGDAAALMFTAGVAMQMPESLFDPGATLAVFVFQLLSTVPGGQKAAYTAAAVLFVITVVIQSSISLANRNGR